MPCSLIVLTGPPLPGRWSLARSLERRCNARRFHAPDGDVPLGELADALAEGAACVLVDGDLATAIARAAVLDVAGENVARVLVEWSCPRALAEREIFHRYASRPPVLAAAELERYLDDAAVREAVDDEELVDGVVRLSPQVPLDEQVARVLRLLPELPDPPPAPIGRRVMVVEDEPDQRRLLRDVLAELGCQVEVAPDAGVALALLAEGAAVDVLISDQQMPGMTGVDLSREVARRHPSVRTILLTAYGDERLVRRALAAHAVTVLAKPIRIIDLARVLDEASDSPSASR